MKGLMICCLGSLALLTAAAPASAQGRKLTDAELGNVNAGSAVSPSVQVPKAATAFRFQRKAGSTQTVRGNGLVSDTAGSSLAAPFDLIQKKPLTVFNFEGQAGSTHRVKGNGTISLNAGPITGATSNLILQGEAQQNLRSLVNIVAVNSRINVLVNLNVNINSTVGAVGQANSSLSH